MVMKTRAITEVEDTSFAHANGKEWFERQEKPQWCGSMDKVWTVVNIAKSAILVPGTRSASKEDLVQRGERCVWRLGYVGI